MATTGGEQQKTRKELVSGAHMGRYALWTAIIGTVVGGVTLAALVAGTHTVLQQNNSTIDLSQAWDTLGRRNALVLGGLMFLSYLLATFVAGRMAWRRGWLHGLAAEIDLRERIEATSPGLAPSQSADSESVEPRREPGSRPVDVDALSKEELYEMAQARDIPGRSQMTKDQLKDAVVQER